MRRLALLAAFLIAACGSFGAEAHTLSLAYKTGDTYKYSLHAVLKYTVGAQGLSIPIELDLSAKEAIKVKSVDSSGTADLQIELTDLTVKTTTNGVTNTTTTTNSTTVEMKVGSDGRIVSVNGETFSNGSLPGFNGSGGGLVSAILPDKPVKPGDTWIKDYDHTSPAGTGTIHVTSKNKYARDETTNNVSTAVVQSDVVTTVDLTVDLSAMAGQSSGASLLPSGGPSAVKGISIKGTSTSTITSWIDFGAHRVVKTHSTGNVDATLTLNTTPGSAAAPGLTGPISFKGTQTLDMKPA